MPRWQDDDDSRDDWDDDHDGDEEENWNDASDPYGDDTDPTTPCPWCGAEIYYESPRCPECGQYADGSDAPRTKKPLWIIVTVIILLVLTVWSVFSGIFLFSF